MTRRMFLRRPMTRYAVMAALFTGCAPAAPLDRATESARVSSPLTTGAVAGTPSAAVVTPLPKPQLGEPETGVMPTRTPPLAVGALAPKVALVDQRGVTVSVQKALEQGPVALIFYRGRW